MAITTHTTTRLATVVAALLGALAVAAPLAHATSADAQACLRSAAGATALPSPYPGWVTIVDDLGLPWLEPAGQPSCSNGLLCMQTGDVSRNSTMQTPYPGWVFVTDAQGIPWLEPIAQVAIDGLQDCGSSSGAGQDAAVSPAANVTGQPAPAANVTGQPAPAGWVFVTDELGVPWLVPTG